MSKAAKHADGMRRVVRVTGERNGLIEFEYGINDLSMAIELLLPPAAFEAFCEANQAEKITSDVRDDMTDDERSMAWRPSDVQRRI